MIKIHFEKVQLSLSAICSVQYALFRKVGAPYACPSLNIGFLQQNELILGHA